MNSYQSSVISYQKKTSLISLHDLLNICLQGNQKNYNPKINNLMSHASLLISIFLWSMVYGLSTATAQEYYPQTGIKDKRTEVYAFTNATLHVDYKTVIEKATLVITDGVVTASGTNITAPKNAVVIDVNGAHIYPSFIELYSDYGLPELARVKKEGFAPQYESNKKGAFGWNQAIKTEQEAYSEFSPSDDKAKALREAGFATVLTHFKDGIARGSGSLVLLGNEAANKLIISPTAATFYSFDKGTSTQAYPSSMMGVIALLRQTYYDAQWYAAQQGKTDRNISLEKWNELQQLPQFFEANDVLNILRADKLGDEFGMQYIIKGNGAEYQKLEDLKATNAKLLIPLNFPKPFDVEDPFDASNVSLAEMKHWEMAPANAYLLSQQNIEFAFTSAGLEKITDVIAQLQKVVQYGLSKEAALKALTQSPATFVNQYNKVGSLEKGKIANFFIATDDIFEKKTKLTQHWVRGKQHVMNDWDFKDIRGNYELSFSNKKYKVVIDGELLEPKLKLALTDTPKIDIAFSRKQDFVSLQFSLEKDSSNSLIRFSGIIDNNTWKGKGQLPDGTWHNWEMKYVSAVEKKEEKKTDTTAVSYGKIIYPFVAYGYEEKPKQENILFKNATVWTNEQEGILQQADVLISNGKIAAVGKNIDGKGATVIDAANKHLTSGIIDEHSHIAISRGVNEATKSSSAEVRIGDVVNSEDINIYRQLAGGVVAAQLLHGSANAIGGQSALIKLRWGFTPEKMKIEGADGFIKFALGENVKQANWGDFNSIRFPQTRMGVEQVYVDHFTRAKEYDLSLAPSKTKGVANAPALRRDLELETIAEIINSKRFITCHSYVQSEINMLMHVADSFGFKVNTFTHILEGYKLADKMKAHGVSASTFADWWAYKFEVAEAIPQNAGILEKVGVNTAINSDDAEMGRRLNQEAAKSIKYAGMSEEEAWKMVTLNPAKMLHLDNRMGSIKNGKDADIVLWNNNPLSIYAKPEMTFLDGYRFFDAEKDKQLRTAIAAERNRLMQKMLDAKKGGAPTQKPVKKEQKIWHCEDWEEEGEHEHGGH
jgi:imidazolonepropionase-like amidohydrolase